MRACNVRVWVRKRSVDREDESDSRRDKKKEKKTATMSILSESVGPGLSNGPIATYEWKGPSWEALTAAKHASEVLNKPMKWRVPWVALVGVGIRS